MLVLSRKVGERILLGEGIEIVITAVRGDRVRVGIEAGRDVPIRRAELARQKITINQSAVVVAGSSR